ncbi:cell wall metabolism sensor histidine kinase WalK [cf. Phormidesmis sp. LEGE 11477]|uniref:sensor histidine kinase n=1 Tax=cf. Phormidesmis sp. LEGE 11477 TaxID=1828680 RepID=UPI001D144B8F|nr:HAMP domain-containing sensor histidine kinase [cf. Phormidesmis sp. LEGE 11477]
MGQKKVGLRNRLLVSQLIVLAVTITSLAVVSRLYTPRYFVVTLERMELRGVRIQQQVKGQLLRGFEGAWVRGLFWAFLLGGASAGGVSWWLSWRITRPLLRMETITRQFAAGNFSSRVPPLEIPEFDRLGHSFNRMANDLEDVEQRRRELVGDLTHELRTPLTIVKGYLEGLADGAIAPTPETYDRLAKETERLQRLVNDLQELSRLESGYLPIDPQAVMIAPLVTQVCDRFADQLIHSDRLQLTTNFSENLPTVWGDPARIEQILVNLLSNALRHTDVGEVRVRVYTQSVEGTDFVWIDVTDTGEGIEEADIPHVFERFWRADRSRDRISGGSGIGLAICRRLVELQGGTITAASRIGGGSTFSFSLPVTAGL